MNQAISSNKQADLINLGRTSFIYLLWEFNPLFFIFYYYMRLLLILQLILHETITDIYKSNYYWDQGT